MANLKEFNYIFSYLKIFISEEYFNIIGSSSEFNDKEREERTKSNFLKTTLRPIWRFAFNTIQITSNMLLTRNMI